MPTSTRGIRLAHIAIYAVLTAAGIGILAWHPLELAHTLGPKVTIVLGVMVTISALACLISALAHRWRIEWIALYTLGAGVTGYALVAWSVTFGVWPGRMVEACISTVVAITLAERLWTLARWNRESLRAPRMSAVWRAGSDPQ